MHRNVIHECGYMKDPKHLKALRKMPCVVWEHPNLLPVDFAVARDVGSAKCGGPVDAHHPTGSGLSLKAPDHEAFPMCHTHHMARHDARGLFRDVTKARMKEWERAMSALYRPKSEEF